MSLMTLTFMKDNKIYLLQTGDGRIQSLNDTSFYKKISEEYNFLVAEILKF